VHRRRPGGAARRRGLDDCSRRSKHSDRARPQQSDLLAALCCLVSSEVQVYVHEPGWPYRAQFSASLVRVQSLVPGGGAMIFEFEGGESLSLGPSEVVDFHPPTGVRPLGLTLSCAAVPRYGSSRSRRKTAV
jgi:hypothetical protein